VGTKLRFWSGVQAINPEATSLGSRGVAPRVPRIAGRIPSLDGVRALSIGLVLLAHLTGTQHFPVGLLVREGYRVTRPGP